MFVVENGRVGRGLCRSQKSALSVFHRFKQKRRRLVERTAVARLPTQWGAFKAYSYTSQLDGIEHIAMVKVSCYCIRHVACLQLRSSAEEISERAPPKDMARLKFVNPLKS